jgi:hypothetical protein
MFQIKGLIKRTKSAQIMKYFSLATILLMLLITFGCSDSDHTIPSPTNDLADADIQLSPQVKITQFPFFDASHKQNINVYDYTQKLIGIEGDVLIINRDGNVIVKQSIKKNALIGTQLISVEMISDDSSWVYLHCQPHGLVFEKPAELEIYLAESPKPLEDDLILYYYDENSDQWVEETTGIFDDQTQGARFKINHFSYYYYERR